MKKGILVASGVGVAAVLGAIWFYVDKQQSTITGDYLYSDSKNVSLLALTETRDGTVSGTLYSANLSTDHVSSNNVAVTGQANGNHMTLNIGGTLGALFGGSISGEKNGNSISLLNNSQTLVYTSGTMNQFQQAERKLQAQAQQVLKQEKAQQQAQEQAQAAAQAAQAQQAQVEQNNQNAVDSAASAVNDDIANLPNDLTNMGDDLTSMGDDLTQQGDDVTSAGDDLTSAQDDYQNGSNMSSDVATLQNDIATQEQDFQRLKNQDLGVTLAKDESQINADISAIKRDFATYQSVSQEYGLTASGGSPDIQSVISNAETTLAQYHSTESSYLKQSQKYIATVQGYASQVKSMAK